MAQANDVKKRDVAQELREDLEILKSVKRGDAKLRRRTFVMVTVQRSKAAPKDG